MAKLTLYPYTSCSYLSAATVEHNEDPGPEHRVIKSMAQLQLSVFTPSLKKLFGTLPHQVQRTLLDPRSHAPQQELIIMQIPCILTAGNRQINED